VELAAIAALPAASDRGERGSAGGVSLRCEHTADRRRDAAAAQGGAAVEERGLAGDRDAQGRAGGLGEAEPGRPRSGLSLPRRDRAAGADGRAGDERAGAGSAGSPRRRGKATPRDGDVRQRVTRGVEGIFRGADRARAAGAGALHRGRQRRTAYGRPADALHDLRRSGAGIEDPLDVAVLEVADDALEGILRCRAKPSRALVAVSCRWRCRWGRRAWSRGRRSDAQQRNLPAPRGHRSRCSSCR
jgi:hypothetical protein